MTMTACAAHKNSVTTGKRAKLTDVAICSSVIVPCSLEAEPLPNHLLLVVNIRATTAELDAAAGCRALQLGRQGLLERLLAKV